MWWTAPALLQEGSSTVLVFDKFLWLKPRLIGGLERGSETMLPYFPAWISERTTFYSTTCYIHLQGKLITLLSTVCRKGKCPRGKNANVSLSRCAFESNLWGCTRFLVCWTEDRNKVRVPLKDRGGRSGHTEMDHASPQDTHPSKVQHFIGFKGLTVVSRLEEHIDWQSVDPPPHMTRLMDFLLSQMNH